MSKPKELKYNNFEFTIQMNGITKELAKRTYDFIKKTIPNKSNSHFSVLWKINRKVIE